MLDRDAREWPAAADEIDAALAAYHAMEMPYWRARAEAQRADLA